MIALNGSTKNDKEISSEPALNQSNIGWVKDASALACLAAYTSENTPQLNKKEANTVPLPIKLTAALGNAFLPKPLTTKPAKGSKGINQIKSIMFVIVYSNSSGLHPAHLHAHTRFNACS
jgi:hypothetical protein